MAKRTDPENQETRALLEMVYFSGQHVLEIGCGDGSKTFRYADKAARVTAIDIQTPIRLHWRGNHCQVS